MNVQERVKSILGYSHRARNSDKELWIIYAQKSGMNLTPEQVEVFRKMPASETIRRTRQVLQQKGLYPADQKVDAARFEKFRQMRHRGTETPEQILEIKGTIQSMGW